MGRVVILPKGCKVGSKPHQPHYWVEGWFCPKIIDCPGVPEDEVEPHRHFYKLTDVLKYDDYYWNRQVVPIDVIAWQCDDCYSIQSINRIKLKEQMMPQWGKVEQTWPS